MKKSEIKLMILLDDKNIPKKIEWVSDDPPSNGVKSEAKAFFLSLFDKKSLETIKIDLWSDDLQIGEMDRMVYYSLKGIADTYFKSTKNSTRANDIARFAQYFGEESGILKKESE